MPKILYGGLLIIYIVYSSIFKSDERVTIRYDKIYKIIGDKK